MVPGALFLYPAQDYSNCKPMLQAGHNSVILGGLPKGWLDSLTCQTVRRCHSSVAQARKDLGWMAVVGYGLSTVSVALYAQLCCTRGLMMAASGVRAPNAI